MTYISVHDIQNVLAVEWARAQVLDQKGLRQCSTTAAATRAIYAGGVASKAKKSSGGDKLSMRRACKELNIQIKRCDSLTTVGQYTYKRRMAYLVYIHNGLRAGSEACFIGMKEHNRGHGASLQDIQFVIASMKMRGFRVIASESKRFFPMMIPGLLDIRTSGGDIYSTQDYVFVPSAAQGKTKGKRRPGWAM